jgi:dihydroxyacid dehydratase/phosphogluconate dehydratase
MSRTPETLRSYPADGAVLLGGCDKTTPALFMAAASAGLPAIYVPAGPMLRGTCDFGFLARPGATPDPEPNPQ